MLLEEHHSPVDRAGLGLEVGDVDVHTSAGLLGDQHGCHRRDRGHRTAVTAHQVAGELERFPLRDTGGVHGSAHGVVDDLCAPKSRLRVWSVLPERGDAGDDQSRVRATQGRRVEPELASTVRPEGLQHDVGTSCEAGDHGPVVFAGEIGHHRPLVGVEVQMERALLVDHLTGIRARERPPASDRVTARWLDLDDVGAEHREQAPGIGAGDTVGQLDDA